MQEENGFALLQRERDQVEWPLAAFSPGPGVADRKLETQTKLRADLGC